ncbi:MAG: PLDc N-terminal domain-containing protein [Candidatus Freyarchaeota archaeon]
MYRDARDRGMEAALWLLIVLLTGPLGLIIYLMVRE